MSDDEAPEKTPERSRLRRWLPVALRFAIVGALVVWFAVSADLVAFASALASLPAWSVGAAAILGFLILVTGAVRWRVTMSAFGPKELPSLAAAIRLYFVGHFYNTFVPGSVGGDVVRGVVSRRCFDTAAASYLVVLIERLIGFAGMGLVFLLGLAIGPDILALREYLPWLIVLLAIGLAAGALTVASSRLSQKLRQVPPVRRPLLLVWSLGLTLISHVLGVTKMYVLVLGMGLPVSYAALVLIMPIAFTAAFIPLNVLGMGTREVTLLALLGLMGIASEQAVALSLGYGVITLATAGLGGVLQLFGGRLEPAEPEA
jgi:glycosyltransferase 2 family protein